MDITATEFIKQAAHTAEYFGFRPLHSFKKEPACKNCKDHLKHRAGAADRKQDALHGLLSGGLNSYTDHKLYAIEEPVFYYTVEQVPRSGETALTLQIFGVERSIAEAVLIQATRSLVNDLGFHNHTVRVNSLGDRDSIARYLRELTNFMKKRLEVMPASARELMKDHVQTALMHLIEKEHELAYKSPSPLEYLSDPSRRHFREIVEYLDMSETPYEIDPRLLGHYQCYSDALFAIDLYDSDNQPLAHPPLYVRGGRYSNFVERYLGRPVPAAGAVIVLRDKKAPKRTPRGQLNGDPSVYVVQLGFGPKIRSLLLIDRLRQAGVPVHQNLASDSLSTQLRDAEEKKVKYTVIIGQKEFVEDTVILRDMIGRNQEHVPLDSLESKLRRASVAV